MTQPLPSGPEPTPAELVELGIALGRSNAFGLVAGRCSAAQAEAIHRLREEKLFKRCMDKWEEFCPKYLRMSRSEADRTVKLWEEFGPKYFELSQLTRISAEVYRAIAPHIVNNALRHAGEVIELNAENAQKVAAVVSRLRGSLPQRNAKAIKAPPPLSDAVREEDMEQLIGELQAYCLTSVAELGKMVHDPRLGGARGVLQLALTRIRLEVSRVEVESGLYER